MDKTNNLEHRVTVEEAMRLTDRTRQAITHAIRTGALPAIKESDSPKARYWIDPWDLRQVYPPETRGPGRRTKLIVQSVTFDPTPKELTPEQQALERLDQQLEENS